MGDIGDYIYLIVLAIAGISSFLKKKKKPEELKPAQTSEYDLEEVLRELEQKEYGSYEQPTQPAQANQTPMADVPKQLEQPVVVQYESVKQYMEKMQKEKKKQKIANTNADPFAKRNAERRKRETDASDAIIFAENEANNELNFSFATVDEAKRAFVYSEIFNRRYS